MSEAEIFQAWHENNELRVCHEKLLPVPLSDLLQCTRKVQKEEISPNTIMPHFFYFLKKE